MDEGAAIADGPKVVVPEDFEVIVEEVFVLVDEKAKVDLTVPITPKIRT